MRLPNLKSWMAIAILLLLFANCKQKKLEREIADLEHKVDSLTQVTIQFEKVADAARKFALRQRDIAQKAAEHAQEMAEKARKEAEEAAAQN